MLRRTRPNATSGLTTLRRRGAVVLGIPHKASRIDDFSATDYSHHLTFPSQSVRHAEFLLTRNAMKHSILLLLLTAAFLRPSLAQELGEEVDDLRLAALSPTKVRLSWTPFEAADRAASVTYSVFRGATESFAPSLRNRIATGLTTTSYVTTEPAGSKDYYYYVKAVVTPGDPMLPQSSPCHTLIQQISQQIGALGSDEVIDQQREMKWDYQLLDCRYKTEQMFPSDWPKLFDIESTLRFSDIKSLSNDHTALLNYQVKNYVPRKDYDDLWKLAQHVDETWTHDYNELVDRYNGLLRTVKSAPPTYVFVPSRHQSIHCTATQLGVISSVDCD
jgi:hypothetical protein